MKFPDFIIVGAMKCGTTVLWHNLNKHPDINMCKNPEDPKKASTEIRFWNNGQPHYTWSKGFDWYKGLFSGKCCGEKSANYIEDRRAMKRIFDFAPNTKIILCIRNPVDRAYSEYCMQHKDLKPKFSMDLVKQLGYLSRGLYYNLIMENVLPFFPKKHLFILIQEVMKSDINGELNKIYEFLGVERCNFSVREVSAKEATDRNLDLEKDKDDKLYKKWGSKYPPMSDKIRSKLIEFYQKPNEDLFRFLGYRIDW